MKKRFLIVLLLASCFAFVTKAQKTQFSFFDERGLVRLQTIEFDALADTIAVMSHRSDDIVWMRTVYRVIDMREKQNYRLYFPVRYDNPNYKNLFKVILDAICEDGLTAYERGVEFIPRYDRPLTAEDLQANMQLPKETEGEENSYLIEVDALGTPQLNVDNFTYYVRDQLKYVIQEVVFFDKHTSRLYSKILGIAPLYSAHPYKQDATAILSLRTSLLFWVLFDDLRPYLAKNLVINTSNELQRMTFDDFFVQKLYSDYLLGDNNVFGRMLLDYDKVIDESRFEAFIKKEQKRIETELLNFEQDLWEY